MEKVGQKKSIEDDRKLLKTSSDRKTTNVEKPTAEFFFNVERPVKFENSMRKFTSCDKVEKLQKKKKKENLKKIDTVPGNLDQKELSEKK